MGKNARKVVSRTIGHQSAEQIKKTAAVMQRAQQQNDKQELSDEEEEPSISGFLSSITSQFNMSAVLSAKYVLQAVRSEVISQVNTLPIPHYVYDTSLNK